MSSMSIGDMARTEDVAAKFTDSSIAGRSWHHQISASEDLQELRSHTVDITELPIFGNI